MAVLTLYWKDAVPTGATLHRSLQNGGSAPTTATTTTGWVVNSNALGQACLQQGGSEVGRNDSSWGTTLQPSAAPAQTTGDSWRSELPLDGTFANAAWAFTFGIRSVTAAYTGRLKLAVRVWKSSNPNGTGAVELTSGRQASAATSASLTTTADTTVTISPTFGGTLRGEYLFVNVGVEITSAGSGVSQDVDFRVGSAYTIATPDFTPTPIAPNPTCSMATLVALPLLALSTAFAPPNIPANTPLASAPVVNAPFTAPDARRLFDPRDTTSDTPLTLLTTSSDQGRGALYVGKREFARVLAVTDTTADSPLALLVPSLPQPPTLPAVPLSAPDLVRSVVDTSRGTPKSLLAEPSTDVPRITFVNRRETPRFVVPDTTSDTPLTLLVPSVAAAPTVPPGALAVPERVRGVHDTSRGTPKPLLADGQAPVGEAQTATPPDRVRPVADTSRGAPKALIADAQAPVGEAQTATPPDRVRPVSNTSLGTPKTLSADAQAPVGEQALAQPPDRVRPSTDTSAGTAQSLLVQPAQPVPIGVNAQTFAPDRPRPVADSSRSTPKPLVADAQAPAGGSAETRVQARPHIGRDTSRGTPQALIDLLPPGAAATLSAPQLPRANADASSGSPLALVGVVAQPAPVANPPDARAMPRRDVADTSASTPKALLVEVLPTGSASLEPLQRPPRLGLDTSAGTPKALYADVALPVGASSLEPVQWPLRLGADTSLETPPVAAQDVQPAPPPIEEPVHGGFKQWRPAVPTRPILLDLRQQTRVELWVAVCADVTRHRAVSALTPFDDLRASAAVAKRSAQRTRTAVGFVARASNAVGSAQRARVDASVAVTIGESRVVKARSAVRLLTVASGATAGARAVRSHTTLAFGAQSVDRRRQAAQARAGVALTVRGKARRSTLAQRTAESDQRDMELIATIEKGLADGNE